MKLILLVLMFGLFNCYQSERNCKEFQTGTFQSIVILDGIEYKSDFVRNKNIQVEIYNGKKDSSQVRWINDCEAIFKTIHPKNMNEEKDIHLKILTTTDTSYTYEYSYVGETKKQKGNAFKIKS